MEGAVLVSVRPEMCAKIVRGEKTVLVRKTFPHNHTPFKCYIYCTFGERKIKNVSTGETLWANDGTYAGSVEYDKPYFEYNWPNAISKSGTVFGEFVCDCIDSKYWWEFPIPGSGITEDKVMQYLNENYNQKVYCWNIFDLKIYDEPKELFNFCKPKGNSTVRIAPRDWMYIKEKSKGD